MAFISKWLNDQHQSKMADIVVEDTLQDLTRREEAGSLDPWMPVKVYQSRKFLAYVTEQLNTIASLVAYGQEPPVTNQGTFRKINAELLKSSLSLVWDEEYQWHMKEAMEEAASKGITVQKSRDHSGKLVGANADLASFIFGNIKKLALAQSELLNHLTWQVLQFGKIDRVDPRTNLKTTISYLNPFGRTASGTVASGDLHFPNALVGTGGTDINPTHRWSSRNTADGLQNLFDAQEQYIDTNGFGPDAIYMSRKLLNHLMAQKSTKDAASSLSVTQVGTVSHGMLGALLDARSLPKIITFDEKFKNELANKELVNANFLNTDRIVFVKEAMGERAMGPTLENKGKQGIHVMTYQKSEAPPVDVTVTSATILPIVVDPNLLYSWQVNS